MSDFIKYEDMEISLSNVIRKVDDISIIKYILYNEANKNNMYIFEDYIKAIEKKDIRKDIKLYIKTILEDAEIEINEENINIYFETMGNKEILKALK